MLQLTILFFEVSDFCGSGFPFGITGQALLPGFQELLAPALIDVLINPFPAAQLSDAVFTA